MVDYICGVGGIELMQYRDDYRAISYGPHEYHDPVDRILAEKRNLVTRLYADLFKKKVKPRDAPGKMSVGQCTAAVVAERGQVEIARKRILIYRQEIRIIRIFFNNVVHGFRLTEVK